MKNPILRDDPEIERLYFRILRQKGNAFFCVVADDPSQHLEIAKEISSRFPACEAQIIDFRYLSGDFQFSSETLSSIMNKGNRVLFLANFQLSPGDLPDAGYFQVLNLSRDHLAEWPCVLVFMMPLYFRIKIAREAPDFNSFFQYRAEFRSNRTDRFEKKPDNLGRGFSVANRELLGYYLEKFNGIDDHSDKQTFDLLLNILYLNTSVRQLHFVELNRFYDVFQKLLLKYKNELEKSEHEIATVFFHQGDYTKALEWYQKALVNGEKTLGVEHPDIAATYNDIAGAYSAQGDYTKALEWYQKALAIREKALGVGHPDTATTYNDITELYINQGHYSKALEWAQKALIIREKVFGVDHPETVTTYNDIAIQYIYLGDYTKASEWNQKASAMQGKVLGTEQHSETAITYNNIAAVYFGQGDYDKALEWTNKALAISEKALGKEHPEIANYYNNIAEVYFIQRDYDNALLWYQKVLSIRGKVFGKEHPTTLQTIMRIENIR